VICGRYRNRLSRTPPSLALAPPRCPKKQKSLYVSRFRLFAPQNVDFSHRRPTRSELSFFALTKQRSLLVRKLCSGNLHLNGVNFASSGPLVAARLAGLPGAELYPLWPDMVAAILKFWNNPPARMTLEGAEWFFRERVDAGHARIYLERPDTQTVIILYEGISDHIGMAYHFGFDLEDDLAVRLGREIARQGIASLYPADWKADE